ncbi:MAG: hypothetical protein KI786_06860 [Mameliella sp.]|nr:hypothetical protein [Phaeodactylibacter sp.]
MKWLLFSLISFCLAPLFAQDAYLLELSEDQRTPWTEATWEGSNLNMHFSAVSNSKRWLNRKKSVEVSFTDSGAMTINCVGKFGCQVTDETGKVLLQEDKEHYKTQYGKPLSRKFSADGKGVEIYDAGQKLIAKAKFTHQIHDFQYLLEIDIIEQVPYKKELMAALAMDIIQLAI